MKSFVAFASLLVLVSAQQQTHTSQSTPGLVQEHNQIYVLRGQKQVQNQIDLPQGAASFQPQKPEVFFVDYKQAPEVVRSQVKYESVSSINGFEHGGANGVPYQVKNAGPLQDEPSNPEQAQIARAIYEALRVGGIMSGLSKLDELVQGPSTSVGSNGQFH